jgi:hypothetical protein
LEEVEGWSGDGISGSCLNNHNIINSSNNNDEEDEKIPTKNVRAMKNNFCCSIKNGEKQSLEIFCRK